MGSGRIVALRWETLSPLHEVCPGSPRPRGPLSITERNDEWLFASNQAVKQSFLEVDQTRAIYLSIPVSLSFLPHLAVASKPSHPGSSPCHFILFHFANRVKQVCTVKPSTMNRSYGALRVSERKVEGLVRASLLQALFFLFCYGGKPQEKKILEHIAE